MVRVKGTKSYFNIHQSLLVDQAPDLEIIRDDKGVLNAGIRESKSTIEVFANWLYTQKIPYYPYGRLKDNIKDIAAAYELGRDVRSVDFMDEMLDELIRQVTSGSPSYDEVFNVCALVHSESQAWNFLVDFIVRCCPNGRGSDYPCAYELVLNATMRSCSGSLPRGSAARDAMNCRQNVSKMMA